MRLSSIAEKVLLDMSFIIFHFANAIGSLGFWKIVCIALPPVVDSAIISLHMVSTSAIVVCLSLKSEGCVVFLVYAYGWYTAYTSLSVSEGPISL